MNWRVAFRGVFPDMKPCSTPDIVFDRWFGDNETEARRQFDAFEGDAIIYTADSALGKLGDQIVARKYGKDTALAEERQNVSSAEEDDLHGG